LKRVCHSVDASINALPFCVTVTDPYRTATNAMKTDQPGFAGFTRRATVGIRVVLAGRRGTPCAIDTVYCRHSVHLPVLIAYVSDFWAI
jgi:hypothetical protein